MENLEKKVEGKKELFAYVFPASIKEMELFESRENIKSAATYLVFCPEDFGFLPGGALEKYTGRICSYLDFKKEGGK